MQIYFYKIPDSSDSHYRGIGFYASYLAKNIEKLGHKVSYFSSEKDIKFIRNSKLEIRNCIVHYPWLHPYFLTAPMQKKYKRVITVHDLIPLKFPQLYPPGIRAKLAWFINKRIIQQADAIITDSLTSKNDILRFGWSITASKVHLVPLAPDPLSKPISKPKLSAGFPKLIKLKKFILYVGDANPSKNLPRLVKAIIKLKIPLVLVGSKFTQTDYDHSHIENKDLVFVQKMIKKHPKLLIPTGFISQADLTSLYNLAVVYCQPSLEEGFGLPVIDAMACGCPVAVSQTSSLIELTKSSAFLFDPLSVESMQFVIKEAMGNSSQRKQFSAWGIKRAKQYSWQKTAKQTLAVYGQILDNKL